MIVSQFHLFTARGQRHRLLITNLESVAIRFRVRYTAVGPSFPGLPANTIKQIIRDATALDGFDSKIDWVPDATAGLYVASGLVEIGPRFTAAVAVRGRGVKGDLLQRITLTGHVELTYPAVTASRGQGLQALGRAARVLLSASSVKTHDESIGNLPDIPIAPEILIGPSLLASGKAEHLIEPEPAATTASAATARAAPKRRAAKRKAR